MNVEFVDRWCAISMIKSGEMDNFNLISINDTTKDLEYMRSLRDDDDDAIFVKFQDEDSELSGFTEELADSLNMFIDESFKKKKDIIVHCFAGVSRSGAVAKYINEYYGLGDRYLEDYVGHNKHVYYTMLEAQGVETLRSYYKILENN